MDEEHVDISVDEEERWLDFVESGMHFRYEKNRTYLIEKTTLYNTLRNKRIKTVECVVIKEKYLFFIEAKTTAPNPQGEKGLERFNAFIEEIFSKFIHSLQLCYATAANIQTEDTGDPYKQSKEFLAGLHNGPCIRFLLIIKNSRPEWNSQIQDMLQMKLNSQQLNTICNTIWKSTIIVMNETQAKARKLIVD